MSSWVIAGVTTIVMFAGILGIAYAVVWIMPDPLAPGMIWGAGLLAGAVGVGWIVFVLESLRLLLT